MDYLTYKLLRKIEDWTRNYPMSIFGYNLSSEFREIVKISFI